MSRLNQNAIRHKIGLQILATELGNVSKACTMMGLPHDTFYRYQNAVSEGGIEAMLDSNSRKPKPKYRVEKATKMAIIAYTSEQPAHGASAFQQRTASERHLCFALRRSLHLATQ